MSDIQKRIVTIFEARGSGQIRAALGEMRSGFSGWRGEARQMNQELSVVDRQIRALGTTARYALAGTTIFGSFQQIRTLGEYSAKLGEIQAIARGPGGIPLLDSQIDSLGQTLLRVSTDTATPIDELQSGVIALYSTIGDVPQNEAAAMMETIASTARVSQAGIDDTTNALLGMLNAFGRGTDELESFGDQFFRVIQLSAGMPGHVYSQQLGRLQSAAALGGFTPEQMGGLAIGATRFGGSPAVNMRGLAQLMRTTLDPANKNSETVLAGIGLGRARRQELGGYGTLQEILRIARERGVAGASGRGAGARLASAVDEIGEGATNQQLGISGEGARLLGDIYTRSEGRAIAAILSQLQTPDQVQGTTNRTLDYYISAVAGLEGDVRGVDEAMADAMDYRRINQAGTALHNMGLEFSSAFAPLLNLGARGITGLEDIVREHNEVAAYGALGAVGAGLAARRAGLRIGPRSLIRGFGVTQAITDTATAAGHPTERGASPTNPVWVAVAFSLSGPGAGGMFGRRGRSTPPIPTGTGGRGSPTYPGAGRSGGRFGGLRGIAGKAGLVGAALFAEDIANSLGILPGQEHGVFAPGGRKATGSSPLDALFHRAAAPDRVMKELKLKARGEVTVNVKTPEGTQRHTVPLEFFSDFTQPAPQTRGQNKTHRGG